MVPCITAVLTRLKTDWATQLQPDAIKAACQEAGYTSWRDRVLTPVTTIQVFLLQVLHGNTACRHVPHLSGLRFSASADCQARARLPLNLFGLLLTRLCTSAQSHLSDDGRWHGHRTFLVDGSGGSMPESSDVTGRLRPAERATAGVRLSRGTAPRPVSCGHWRAPEAGGRTPAHPRSHSGTGGPSSLTPRGRARGRSRPVFVCASRPPRPGWRTRRAPRRCAPAGGLHAGSALCHAEYPADPRGQRYSTVTLAQNARRP